MCFFTIFAIYDEYVIKKRVMRVSYLYSVSLKVMVSQSFLGNLDAILEHVIRHVGRPVNDSLRGKGRCLLL